MQGTLARKLRVLRAERGLTLRDAERLTGVDKDTLSKIERGARHPQDVTLSKIAKGYGIPVSELLEELVLAGKAEAPEAGRSEAQAPEETDGARPNVEPLQEPSLLDDPQIIEWLREHGLTWGTMTSAEFEKHVHGLHLEEVDEDGRPVTVMELGRTLGDEHDAALDLLWMRPSKYRSLGGLLSVDPNAPVAEQKNQRRDQLSKLRMELDRRYRRRLYALKRYAEFLTELLAAQKKERKAAFRKILDSAA